MHVKTLILGGGLAGLSTAYHLEKAGDSDYLVLEKEQQPGGLCRSVHKEGFIFDFAGHLLHLHTPQGKKLLGQLLPRALRRQQRRAWIYTANSRVPFPFQAHLHALPPQLQQKCLAGLVAKHAASKNPPKNFKQWCLQSFGTGIYNTFMKPYNTKLWGRPLHTLTCEWCGPFIPSPGKAQIARSVRQKPTQSFGYNSIFYYPNQGGCGALVEALVKHVSNLRTHTPVTHIDLKNKKVYAGRKTFSFDKLVNTLPLPLFLTLLKNEPTLSGQAQYLHSQAVSVFNVAFKGRCKPFSWIYCPDAQDPFYRVGLQSSFSAHQAPSGCYSLYVELPGQARPSVTLEKQIYHALLQKGIINEHDEKLFSFWQFLPYAYVIYDAQRTPRVTRILQTLAKHHCFCAGRYGLWEYSFMEKALLQGKDLAKKLI